MSLDDAERAELERYRRAAETLRGIPVETMAELPYILEAPQMGALVDVRIEAAKRREREKA